MPHCWSAMSLLQQPTLVEGMLSPGKARLEQECRELQDRAECLTQLFRWEGDS